VFTEKKKFERVGAQPYGDYAKEDPFYGTLERNPRRRHVLAEHMGATLLDLRFSSRNLGNSVLKEMAKLEADRFGGEMGTQVLVNGRARYWNKTKEECGFPG